jgi:hypothetical protein
VQHAAESACSGDHHPANMRSARRARNQLGIYVANSLRIT